MIAVSSEHLQEIKRSKNELLVCFLIVLMRKIHRPFLWRGHYVQPVFPISKWTSLSVLRPLICLSFCLFLSVYNPLSRIFYLESSVDLEGCPSISVRAVSYSKTGHILICITSALRGNLGNSNRPFEVKLDPLLPVILPGWPSTLVSTFWFQVQPSKISGVVTIPLARCLYVSISTPSLRDCEALHDGSTTYNIKQLLISIWYYGERANI